MLNAAPPIQGPEDCVIAEIYTLIETQSVQSGPVMCFDRTRGVFLVALVEQGVIFKWSLHSCASEAEADEMKDRYRRGFEALARQMHEQAEESPAGSLARRSVGNLH